MKKVLFSIVIALALAAVSCAKKEVAQEQPTPEVVTDVAVDTGMTTDTAVMAVDTAVAQ